MDHLTEERRGSSDETKAGALESKTAPGIVLMQPERASAEARPQETPEKPSLPGAPAGGRSLPDLLRSNGR